LVAARCSLDVLKHGPRRDDHGLGYAARLFAKAVLLVISGSLLALRVAMRIARQRRPPFSRAMIVPQLRLML
jgi:hypothetical protein